MGMIYSLGTVNAIEKSGNFLENFQLKVLWEGFVIVDTGSLCCSHLKLIAVNLDK